MPFTALDLIEYIAVIASLGYLIMSARQRISTWWMGFVGSVLYVVVFFANGLYGSSLLSSIFVVIMMYGWFRWRYGVDEQPLQVTLLTNRQRILAIICGIALTPLVYLFCSHLTGQSFPLTDAAVAGLSLVAQVLVTHKKLEAWYAWIAINMLAVYTYSHNHLVITALLYVVYVVFSVYGLREWRKSMQASG